MRARLREASSDLRARDPVTLAPRTRRRALRQTQIDRGDALELIGLDVEVGARAATSDGRKLDVFDADVGF